VVNSRIEFVSSPDAYDVVPHLFLEGSLYIAANEEDFECQLCIGDAEIYLFNSSIYSGSEIVEECDAIQEHLYQTISSVEIISESEVHEITKPEIPYVYGKIAILSNIEIREDHRGMGLGLEFMKKIIEYLQLIGFNYILIKPFPVDTLVTDEKIDNEIKRLISFYKQFGFESYSNDGETFMKLNLGIIHSKSLC
jgi:GNAT superfamily N-acetyltransferase